MPSDEKMTESLVKIGFTDKEAKVYLTVLELKEALPGSVARRSGIKRSSTYVLLDRLTKRGLISSIKENGHLYFRANNPERFLRQEIEKFKRVQSTLDELNDKLPELLYLHHTPEEGVEVSVFKGKEGLMQMEKDISHFRGKSYSRKHEKNEVIVYGNKVAIISWDEKMGVVIQNSRIVEAQRKVLEKGSIRSSKKK